jgi:hypothetical protein
MANMATATADGKAEATVARSILKAQETFAKYLGEGDVEMQALSTFLVIAQHGRDYPMKQLQESLGLSQASVSRNVALLSIGTMQNPGPKLIEAYEDGSIGAASWSGLQHAVKNSWKRSPTQ